MKKPWTLIIIGIIATALIGVWLYLFFGGDKAREDIFSAFGLGETLDGIPLPDFFGEDAEPEEIPALRQLSLKPIIGFVDITGSTTPRTVRYAEAGTGHVFDLLIDTGTETRVSNITIPTATKAVFSPDGTHAAIISAEGGRGITVIIATSSEAQPQQKTLAGSAENLAFTNNNELLYTERTGSQTSGRRYNPKSEETTLLFTLPFKDATMAWGSSAASTHVAYPKTSSILEGALYQIDGSTLQRLPIAGFGLSAIKSPDASSVLYMKRVGDIFETLLYRADGSNQTSSVTALPEKCTFTRSGAEMVCAARSTPFDTEFPDSWYRGEISEMDSLWFVNLTSPASHTIVTLSDSGRDIDAVELSLGNYRPAIMFLNKNDRTLWIFDRDFTTPVTDNE